MTNCWWDGPAKGQAIDISWTDIQLGCLSGAMLLPQAKQYKIYGPAFPLCCLFEAVWGHVAASISGLILQLDCLFEAMVALSSLIGSHC